MIELLETRILVFAVKARILSILSLVVVYFVVVGGVGSVDTDVGSVDTEIFLFLEGKT